MMQSIRGRFLMVSVISVVLALAMASVVLISLFTRSLEARVDHELTGHVNTIAGALRFSLTGIAELPPRPGDRRFEEPYGGLYFQVEDEARAATLRSASLWDFTLDLPDDTRDWGAIRRYRATGPEGAELIVQERRITFAAPGGERAIRVAVGIDAVAVNEASRDFALDLLPYMLALAAFLIAASALQLIYGLKPISSVSDGLDRIRERKAERLTGRFPSEFSGLVAAVNQLLDAQAQLIARARSRAADLAHGLKTPLTVLSNDAETLKERGETEIAEELGHLARVMRAHVDHELTRSRLAASAGLRRSDADLATSLDRIVRTLKRTPRGEELGWQIEVPQGLSVGVDPNDLAELIGNILDNAVKWARENITVGATRDAARITLVIEDDGPGASPEGLKTMMERGIRLDMKVPGSGIGLAIVRDIAEVYGLDVTIENRAEGGLRVVVSF